MDADSVGRIAGDIRAGDVQDVRAALARIARVQNTDRLARDLDRRGPARAFAFHVAADVCDAVLVDDTDTLTSGAVNVVLDGCAVNFDLDVFAIVHDTGLLVASDLNR